MMPGSWVLLALALILTLTSIPGGRGQEEASVTAESPDLKTIPNLEDLKRKPGDLGPLLDLLLLQSQWVTKRQHPGKREETAAEKKVDLGEARLLEVSKRQHPGRRDDDQWGEQESWLLDVTGLNQLKRQHPGRRSPWVELAVTKRQHPGRRQVDPKFQKIWEEEEEEGDDSLMTEKRQHPGKRAPGDPCGLQRTCGQAGLLLGLLGDPSRAQEILEKQKSLQEVAWDTEPLKE